ncbi:hypothetical protein OSH10_06490 [Kaistia defluvii]|uniref:hypothetical protein n=1 Tax=Kaistia defluvii TaxID=410841 RepID=UPI00225B95C0|nr:hypothetical protein [Kaistia defluvii]MCX5518077.1 hypothetical protein [Kaistia defluvii]
MASGHSEQQRRPLGHTRHPANRQPIAFIDEFGMAALKVPLDNHGRSHAIVEPHAYQRVLDSGLTGMWFTNSNGHGRRYVRTATAGSRGTLTLIARVIMDAGPGEVIRYANGDSLDLRVMNLLSMRGRAKRRDSQIASSRGNAPAS